MSRKFLQLSDVMAALPFSFRNHRKAFAGRFKAFHFGKAYRDVRQIIIKKVPHRMAHGHFGGKGEMMSYFSVTNKHEG